MTRLLERSLERNRLAHAYLFSGDSLEELEVVARTLAKAAQLRRPPGPPPNGRLHSCGQCDSCRRIEHDAHPDVLWVRPESKSRVIAMDQMRELMRAVHLKPTAAEFKVGVVVAADRLNPAGGQRILENSRRAARQFHSCSFDDRAATGFGNCPVALSAPELRRRGRAGPRPTRGLAGRLQRTGRTGPAAD